MFPKHVRFWDEDTEVDHVDIAKRATQMVEKLSEENLTLRLDVEKAKMKLAHLHRVR